MKKRCIFSFLFSLFFSFSAYSKTLIEREYIPYDNISFLEIQLENEDLLIQKYTGEDILIEIYSNNSNIIPTYEIKNDVFQVQSNKESFKKPIYCIVEIYVPVNFIPQAIEVTNNSGKSSFKNLKAREDFVFTTFDGKTEFENIACESFKYNSYKSDFEYKNLNAESFFIQTYSGNVTLTLGKQSYTYSKIITRTGDIKVTYKKKNDLVFVIYSEKPLIRNKNSYETELFFNPVSEENLPATSNLIYLDSKKASVEIIAE